MAIVPSNLQLQIFNEVQTSNRNICVQATAGCLGIDTPILMYDGSVKKVQEIKVGDKVMGADSTSRVVLSIDSGISPLYRIVPIKGDSWICNDKHIMTVHSESIATFNKNKKKEEQRDPIVDIDLKKLLEQPKLTRSKGVKSNSLLNYRLQRYSVDFKEKETKIDPYLMGLWLGDRQTGGCSIYTIDKPIIDYILRITPESTIRKDKTCYTIYLKQKTEEEENIFYTIFSTIKEKYILEEYLINSENKRLQLLAGLIDSDGYVSNYIEITLKVKKLAEQVVFLCRSLGFAAYLNKVKRKSQTEIESEYYHISISGDFSKIPTKLERKRGNKRKQIKNVLRIGFSISPIGEGRWFGFSVDKDNRFLLGDFTVTHNSGKTTTLLEILKYLPKFKKIVFLSFSNTIVNELKSRVPVHVTASTLHSLGMKMVRRNIGGDVVLDENKWFKIFLSTFDKELRKDKKVLKSCFEMQDIVNFMRMTLTSPTTEDIMEMCDYYSLVYDDQSLVKVIEEFSKPRRKSIIDFTDMIYLPTVLNLIDEQFDYVLLDEAQDLNKCQHNFVEKILKPGGRLISVGDEKQSIYSFSGASIDSFQQLQSRPNTVTLPLSISYRCGKKIVEKAREVYPNAIQAYKGNEDGEVRDGSVEEIREGDLVICRKTQPLIVLFFELLKRRVKAKVVGRDFEVGLISFAEKAKHRSLDVLLNNLEEELNAKEQELRRKGITKFQKHPQYIAVEEKVEVISIILQNINDPELLIPTIKTIFHDDKKSVRLMTIHRSKGLESDKVFVVEKFNGEKLCPSPRAKKNWEKIQEKNLLFVAYTRAKKQLIQITIDE